MRQPSVKPLVKRHFIRPCDSLLCLGKLSRLRLWPAPRLSLTIVTGDGPSPASACDCARRFWIRSLARQLVLILNYASAGDVVRPLTISAGLGALMQH